MSCIDILFIIRSKSKSQFDKTVTKLKISVCFVCFFNTQVVLLVGTTDGQFFLLKCAHGEPVRVQHLDGPVMEEPEKFTVIEPLSTMPQVVSIKTLCCFVHMV